MQNNLGKRLIFKNLSLIVAFFIITPLTLLSSLITLVSISNTAGLINTYQSSVLQNPKPGVSVFASLPSDSPTIYTEVIKADARTEIIRNYLDIYNSPLKPYAEFIVQMSDKYGLDYRLITAIAQKESGLCHVIPEGSHNCWGWGIHSKGTLMFDSYEQGIETVSRGLKQFYLDEGYITLPQIMKKYAHPSSTTWAEGVQEYLDQIQQNS